MRVQPHPHKYPEVEVPDFLMEVFTQTACGSCDDDQESCEKFTVHDCLRDFISDNIGYYLEETKDIVISEKWATFLCNWYEYYMTTGGVFKSNWFELTIDDVVYRTIWFGWTKDLNASSEGYILCYKIEGNTK